MCALTVGRWEPGELRGSRRVLRAPEGETPSGDSPHRRLSARGRCAPVPGRSSAAGSRGSAWSWHAEKTRLIEFGRFAAERRAARGLGKPETFQFLGFTHICEKTRQGRFMLKRITDAKRLRAKLHKLKAEVRRRTAPADPRAGAVAWPSGVEDTSTTTRVPGNIHGGQRVPRSGDPATGIRRFGAAASAVRLNWERMHRLAQRWLPRPRSPIPGLTRDSTLDPSQEPRA